MASAIFGLVGVVVGIGLTASIEWLRARREARGQFQAALFLLEARARNLQQTLLRAGHPQLEDVPAAQILNNEVEHLGSELAQCVTAAANLVQRTPRRAKQIDLRGITDPGTTITLARHLTPDGVQTLLDACSQQRSKL